MEDEDEEEEPAQGVAKGGFDYLLSMSLWSLTYEKVEKLKREKEEKMEEIIELEKKTAKMLWKTDLDEVENAIEAHFEEIKEGSTTQHGKKKTTTTARKLLRGSTGKKEEDGDKKDGKKKAAKKEKKDGEEKEPKKRARKKDTGDTAEKPKKTAEKPKKTASGAPKRAKKEKEAAGEKKTKKKPLDDSIELVTPEKKVSGPMDKFVSKKSEKEDEISFGDEDDLMINLSSDEDDVPKVDTSMNVSKDDPLYGILVPDSDSKRKRPVKTYTKPKKGSGATLDLMEDDNPAPAKKSKPEEDKKVARPTRGASKKQNLADEIEDFDDDDLLLDLDD